MATKQKGKIHHPGPADKPYLHPKLLVTHGWATASQVYLKVLLTSLFNLSKKALDALEKDGLPPSILKKLAELEGQEFESRQAFLHALGKKLSPFELHQCQDFVLKETKLSGRLVAEIKEDDSSASTVLRHPEDCAYDCGCPLWAAVVVEDLDPSKEYELQLLEVATKDLLATTEVSFPDKHHLEALEKARGGFHTYITSPLSGATVCQSFPAAGRTDLTTGVVTGQLTATAGPGGNITGTQGSLSPNGVWSLQFTGLDLNTTYTLTASVGSESATPPSTNLTVKRCVIG
jgi:hypothetical protein